MQQRREGNAVREVGSDRAGQGRGCADRTTEHLGQQAVERAKRRDGTVVLVAPVPVVVLAMAVRVRVVRMRVRRRATVGAVRVHVPVRHG